MRNIAPLGKSRPSKIVLRTNPLKIRINVQAIGAAIVAASLHSNAGTNPIIKDVFTADPAAIGVALTVANGRFVSAAEEGVTLKDRAGKAPGEAESFQWINLTRGDTMFMSLTNHRYLTTKPNEPGPVTATATGPSPARKSGAEFKWKTVE